MCLQVTLYHVLLTAGPPGNPEIWWASISEGSVEGGDELGLIGKKFQSGKRCCCVKLKDDTFLAQDQGCH